MNGRTRPGHPAWYLDARLAVSGTADERYAYFDKYREWPEQAIDWYLYGWDLGECDGCGFLGCECKP